MSSSIVSVIIPAYNAARFLGQALESVFAQTHRPLEVIVVDDGSTDSTIAIATSRDGVTLIQQPNAGASSARNTGLKVASGDYFAFLDADDLWLPEKLSLQVSYLCQNPGVGFLAAHSEHFVEAGMPCPAWFERIDGGAPIVGCLPSAWLVRREVAAAVGEFDVSFSHGEDVDWLARAGAAGFPMVALEEVLVRRRVHDANLSGFVRESQRGLFQALRASARRQRAVDVSP